MQGIALDPSHRESRGMSHLAGMVVAGKVVRLLYQYGDGGLLQRKSPSLDAVASVAPPQDGGNPGGGLPRRVRRRR